MQIKWISVNQNFTKGIKLMNEANVIKFQQLLKRIALHIATPLSEVFTDDERLKLTHIFKMNPEETILFIKSVHYLLKKMLQCVFKPMDLKKDLLSLGLYDDKCESLVSIWTVITKDTLKNVEIDEISNNLEISWQLNTEISSSLNKCCINPTVDLKLRTQTSSIIMELNDDELYKLYLSLESIQSALDDIL